MIALVHLSLVPPPHPSPSVSQGDAWGRGWSAQSRDSPAAHQLISRLLKLCVDISLLPGDLRPVPANCSRVSWADSCWMAVFSSLYVSLCPSASEICSWLFSVAGCAAVFSWWFCVLCWFLVIFVFFPFCDTFACQWFCTWVCVSCRSDQNILCTFVR